jgi:hypothetical protein
MTRALKIKLALLHFGAAIVVFAAGYAQGSYDMWQSVKDALR